MALFVAVSLQDVVERQGGIFLLFFLLDSTVLISIFSGFSMFCLFASFLVVMWLCLLLCIYKMSLKYKVGCFFVSCWIQLS